MTSRIDSSQFSGLCDQRAILVGGLILASFGMLYGLHYALFIEHQTLDHLGASLNQAFVAAAQQQLPESSAALAGYARQSTRIVHVFGSQSGC